MNPTIRLRAVARACSLAALALGAGVAQADPWIDRYPPPNNLALVGLSSNGDAGVGEKSTLGNLLLNAATGTFTPIGGNASSAGFFGSLSISGNGAWVAGNATAPNGYSQAARYDVATGTWTTLGSLNVYNTAMINGLQQQSAALAISADGSTVGGLAYFNAAGSGSGTSIHPVVFRDGNVYDLNSAGTTQSGRVLSLSGDGSVATGYLSNSAAGSIWTWNGSGYVASMAPTAQNPLTLANVAIQATQVSSNGNWVAGGSVNGLARNYNTIFAPNTYSPATLWNRSTNTALLIPFDHEIDTSAAPGTDLISNMKASVVGVSDNGVVIGAFDQCLGCATGILQNDTWIYFASTNTTMSFDSYLASLGLGLAPTQHVWSLFDMAADASAISGIYFDSATGASTSFVLRGLTTPVPEAGTWLMLAMGLPLVAARRLRARAAQQA